MDDAQFIEAYRALVQRIARKLRAELDLHCELDEVVAYGYRGLLEARARYDPTRGVQFSTFAYYRIRGAMLDGVRQMAWAPRRAYARMRAAEATDRVAEELGSMRAAPSDPHAQHGGAERTLEVLDEALGRIAMAHGLGAASQETEDPDAGPEQTAIGTQESSRLRALLEQLPERERRLVDGFYFQGRRFDEVAAELGISKSWASRLHAKALDRLRGQLGDGF